MSRAFEGSSSSSISLDCTSARPIIVRLCSPADISPTGFSARCVASNCSITALARTFIASVTVRFGHSVELEKNPESTASIPVAALVCRTSGSAETTPSRFFNSVRSQRSRPKMRTRVSGFTSG